MNISVHKPFKGYLVFVLVFFAVLLVSFSISSSQWVFLAVLGLGLLAVCIIRRAFLGIVFVMGMHFWFGSIEAGIYPRILSIVFVGLVLFPVLGLMRRISLDLVTRRILWISLAIFLWEIFVNHVVHIQTFAVFVATTARVFLPIGLGALMPLTAANRGYLQKYILTLFVFICGSALVAVLQYLGISWAWQLREIQGHVLHRQGPPGLSLYCLHLSYQLASMLPLAYSMVLVNKFERKRQNIYSWGTVLIAVSLVLTTVRSAILGGAIGVLLTSYMLRKNRRILARFLTATIAIVLVFYFLNVTSELKRVVMIANDSASIRIPLYFSALCVARDNPLFGVGSGRYEETAEDYYGLIYHLRGSHVIGVTGTHNHFLNILVYFGIPGIALLIAFYFILFSKLVSIYKDCYRNCYRYVAVGLIGSYVSYLINSFFHNSGPFISDPYNWFFIGITFVLFKFAEEEKAL
jgi:O-antigen ligase